MQILFHTTNITTTTTKSNNNSSNACCFCCHTKATDKRFVMSKQKTLTILHKINEVYISTSSALLNCLLVL